MENNEIIEFNNSLWKFKSEHSIRMFYNDPNKKQSFSIDDTAKTLYVSNYEYVKYIDDAYGYTHEYIVYVKVYELCEGGKLK